MPACTESHVSSNGVHDASARPPGAGQKRSSDQCNQNETDLELARKQCAGHSATPKDMLHKKQRMMHINEDELAESEMRDQETELERGRHPYGLEPWGNYFQKGNATSIRKSSLGALHVLPDNAVLDMLGFLSARQLGRLACCSRALYVFSHQDELWRALVLDTIGGDFRFETCWKDTLGRHFLKERYRPHTPLLVQNLYSDLLFQPWLCTSLDIRPEWCSVQNIDRRANLSMHDFIAEYEGPNRPVILTDVVTKWPAFKRWDWDVLRAEFGESKVAVGPVDMTMEDYCHYCAEVSEEKPLYVFDKHFASSAPRLAADYSVPEYFADDLFNLLPADTRPDFRWIIAGPKRSGSAFHIDPNATSAWNAVIRGRKKWVLYPPGLAPPGVVPSHDMSEVTSSASLGEWFLNFYPATKTGKVRPLECVCEAGELMYVPRGWWHAVWNLEPSIAITQNFVSQRHAAHVANFLRRKPHCISGLPPDRRPSLLPAFLDAIAQHRPELRKALDSDPLLSAGGEAAAAASQPPSLWHSLVPHVPKHKAGSEPHSDGDDHGAPAFSFGFSMHSES